MRVDLLIGPKPRQAFPLYQGYQCVNIILSTGGSKASSLAVGAIRARSNLGRLSAGVVARVSVADLVVILARVGHNAGVAVVGVNSAKHAAVDSNYVVHNDVTGTAISTAVAAASDNLAVVVGVELGNTDGSEAVELDDLVGSLEGTAADDVGGSAGLLEGTETCQYERLSAWHTSLLTEHLHKHQTTKRCYY